MYKRRIHNPRNGSPCSFPINVCLPLSLFPVTIIKYPRQNTEWWKGIASRHMVDMGGSDHIAGQKARDRLRDWPFILREVLSDVRKSHWPCFLKGLPPLNIATLTIKVSRHGHLEANHSTYFHHSKSMYIFKCIYIYCIVCTNGVYFLCVFYE